jgi:hypothetical protein
MQQFRVWWNSFKTVATLFSFVMNLVSLIVLLILLMQIFKLKNGLAEPLIDGLHRDFVGMDEAVITQTSQANGTVPVRFDLPLNQATNVILTQDVPIAASATFTLPGGGGVINGRVDIVLPKDLILPVQLNMTVPVDTAIPITLPVDIQIPLKETQLHAPLADLRDMLNPYVRVLDNLPNDWSEMPGFVLDAARGQGTDLLSPSEDSEFPWPGSPTGTPLSQPGAIPEPSESSPTRQPVGPTVNFTPFPTLTPTPP